MAIYALADLHLCLSCPEKSMEYVWSAWDNYVQRIKENWEAVVTAEDTVLIPGDISWATYVDKAEEDFRFISELPGRKLLSRGNHDYWWTTMKKMEEFFEQKGFKDLGFVRTNVAEADGCLISGTRGWMIETRDAISGSDNKKIYDRERLRIQMCIDKLNEADPEHAKKHILMIHYPPITSNMGFTEFAHQMAQGGIDICVYGHLHGKSHKKAFEGDFEGTKFICTSADFVGFKPVKIL
ncbi:MAG: metallophosphoesterase [Clostridiales bacterium]|nr:metallophosphoesterase [Clostridiales bacterium]